MEEQEGPRVVRLPNSQAEIRFTDEFKRESLADLTRRLITDDELAERMRKSPSEELEALGIVISDRDRERITDEDILAAMGHRPQLGGRDLEAIGPAAIVIVIVAVVNTPGPAY